MRTKRSAVLALAASAALAIGVTAAWAGFPNMRIADSTFTEGTVTKGGGKTTTSARTLAAVAPSAAQTYSAGDDLRALQGDWRQRLADVHAVRHGHAGLGLRELGRRLACRPEEVRGARRCRSGAQLTLAADRNGRLIYTGDELAIRFAPPS